MSDLAKALFASASRAAVLRLVVHDGLEDSVSGLARRAGLSSRAVAREVTHLARTGLVTVRSLGGADLVRANREHPAVMPLKQLLSLDFTFADERDVRAFVRDALSAWGAPLDGQRRRGRNTPSLPETLLSALEVARHDGTVLRVLPVVLAKNLHHVDWVVLLESARHRKLKAELGMLVELTADLLNQPELKSRVSSLKDRRRHKKRFFPEPRNRFEVELAKRQTPRAAARWGFMMNMTEEAFRTTLERHRA
jgi:hypothetical protein